MVFCSFPTEPDQTKAAQVGFLTSPSSFSNPPKISSKVLVLFLHFSPMLFFSFSLVRQVRQVSGTVVQAKFGNMSQNRGGVGRGLGWGSGKMFPTPN